jgi:hypothetical protein
MQVYVFVHHNNQSKHNNKQTDRRSHTIALSLYPSFTHNTTILRIARTEKEIVVEMVYGAVDK